MFSRVVSNFRKKGKKSEKSLKTSISSPEIKNQNPCENLHSGRTLSAEFDFEIKEEVEEILLSEKLSSCDNERDKLHIGVVAEDKPGSDSGFKSFRFHKINKLRK